MGLFGLVTKKEAELTARIAVMESQQRSSTLQNPSTELIKALQAVGLWGQNTDSGASVNDDTVMGLAAFTRGISLIADGIASMPLKVYEYKNGNRTEIRSMLLDNPNPWQTPFQWKKYMAVMQSARGNAYSRIIRDRYYKATSTIPIHPKYVKPVIVDGDLFYKIEANGHPPMVHHSDMIHWKGLCYSNAVEGISPIEYHAQSLGINLAAEKSQARSNKTSSKQFVIKGAGANKITDPQKISLKSDVQNVSNGESMGFVIPNEVDIEWLSLSPAEMQFIETRKYSAVDIARMLNIPSYLLDANESNTKGSSEQDALNFYTFTLNPKTVDFAEELDRKLLSNPEQYHGFVFNSLLRADAKTRSEVLLNYKRLGWSDNEIRAIEDTNNYEGGDRRYADLNQIPKDLEDPYYHAKIAGMAKSNMNNNPDGNNNNTQN